MTKNKRRYILCKVRSNDFDGLLTIYTNGEWRVGQGEYHEWVLAHSELGPMFVYKYNHETRWQTDWNSEDEDEVKVAETIAKALTDREMEKVLKG